MKGMRTRISGSYILSIIKRNREILIGNQEPPNVATKPIRNSTSQHAFQWHENFGIPRTSLCGQAFAVVIGIWIEAQGAGVDNDGIG